MMPMEPLMDVQDVKVIHFGLSQLGAAIAREVASRDGLISVAAIDPAETRAGRDLGDVIGAGASTGVVVDATPDLLRDIEADIVIYVPDAGPDAAVVDLEACLEAGLNVVTVFPELAYPPDEDDEEELAASIDTLASEADVTALALDPSDALFGLLPLTVTSLASSVDQIVVRRRAAPSALGRLSLADWARMLAEALGWALDDLDERDDGAGAVPGTHRVVGSMAGAEVITVEVVAEPGRTEPLLEIEVAGTPPLKLSLSGGAPPDRAIAALLVNAIPRVLMSEPGLYTLPELPPVHCWTSLGLVPADDFDDE
jgi:4-hydroxy-tetrahydrodipicolinate reductase